MVSNRGYDSLSSKSRLRLIEAATELLAEQGYRAITARRIADRAGLKPQLVHYYFRSMEELVVAVFRRSVASYFQQHDAALSSPNPLRALWELNSKHPDARRVTEYLALGKLYPALRAEMRRTGENYRKLQREAIEDLLARHGAKSSLNAETLATLMSALARQFMIEGEIGLEAGHDELRILIDRLLDTFDPLDQAAETADAQNG